MSAPDDALDPIVERADDRETWIGVKQADEEDREFDMAELQRLRAKVAEVINRQHQRIEPERFGLITWPTCSCGRTETRVMSDNKLAVVPAQHPCFAAKELHAALEAAA